MCIQSVGIVGCGRMGLGLIEAIASAGLRVRAARATGGDLAEVQTKLEKSLAKRVEKGKLTEEERTAILGRISLTSDLAKVAQADLVIETCAEELGAKLELLQRLESLMSDGAILATNTSSLPLETLSAGLKRPAQFLALHFFNPAQIMKLVEIGATTFTAPGVIYAAEGFVREIGKTPVQVQGAPGYVVNRLLVPMLLHAIETLESGIAGAEAIDDAMKLGCGHPMGPLALADMIGLDVVLAMATTLKRELNDNRYRAPSILRRLVLAGHLGQKSGLGIYDYRSVDGRGTPGKPVPNAAIRLGPKPIVTAIAEAAE